MRDFDRREREALDRYLTTEPLLDLDGAEWEPDMPEQPEWSRLADENRANRCPKDEHLTQDDGACVVCASNPRGEESAYADLADELNDADVTMTVDDFDPEMVALASIYADRRGLSFPPGLGDFDRYCERRWAGRS